MAGNPMLSFANPWFARLFLEGCKLCSSFQPRSLSIKLNTVLQPLPFEQVTLSDRYAAWCFLKYTNWFMILPSRRPRRRHRRYQCRQRPSICFYLYWCQADSVS